MTSHDNHVIEKQIYDLTQKINNPYLYRDEIYRFQRMIGHYQACLHDKGNISILRKERRENEMNTFGCYTRPGPWDSDLDVYQKGSYTYPSKVPGYQISLSRNMGLSWNGYVTIPMDHPAFNTHYDDLNAPFDLTFGSDGTFGFDHMHSDDVMPYPSGIYISKPIGKFLTHEMVREECERLVEWFKLKSL